MNTKHIHTKNGPKTTGISPTNDRDAKKIRFAGDSRWYEMLQAGKALLDATPNLVDVAMTHVVVVCDIRDRDMGLFFVALLGPAFEVDAALRAAIAHAKFPKRFSRPYVSAWVPRSSFSHMSVNADEGATVTWLLGRGGGRQCAIDYAGVEPATRDRNLLVLPSSARRESTAAGAKSPSRKRASRE